MNNSISTAAVLHPGQMGTAVAAELSRTGVPVLWCTTGRSTATSGRAEQAELQPVATLAELLDRADVVLSICPPASAEDLAHEVARHRYRGLYVDANAISPNRMKRIHHTLESAGATVLDGAIIGPPPGGATTARLYLSGPPHAATTVATPFAGTTIEPVILDTAIGTASGLKMSYASYQKSSRILAAVAHALAADLGVTDHLLAEATRNTRSPLTDPDYLPSVAARAWRWAPEMLEIADTMRATGLPPEQAEAAATALTRWETSKDQHHTVEHILEMLHRQAVE